MDKLILDELIKNKYIIDIQIMTVELSNSYSNVAFMTNNLFWKGSFSVSYDYVSYQINRAFRYVYEYLLMSQFLKIILQ